MFPTAQSVREIMSEPVIGVECDRKVGELLELASAHQVHHFPVFSHYRLVGFLCTCDLRHAPLDARISEWMRTDVVEVAPDASALDALRHMDDMQVGSVLVKDQHGICGIVTREDLAARVGSLNAALAKHECTFCKSKNHLRATPGGELVCIDCQDRVPDDEWFDTGFVD